MSQAPKSKTVAKGPKAPKKSSIGVQTKKQTFALLFNDGGIPEHIRNKYQKLSVECKKLVYEDMVSDGTIKHMDDTITTFEEFDRFINTTPGEKQYIVLI